MVLLRDTRRFEITVEERDGMWIAKLQGFIPDRLYPTLYLLRQCTTRQGAIEALQDLQRQRVVSAALVQKVQAEGEALLQQWRTAAALQDGAPH